MLSALWRREAFASLIVGLILSTAGEQLANLFGNNAVFEFLVSSGKSGTKSHGPVHRCGCELTVRAPPLVLYLPSVITGAAAVCAAAAGGVTASPCRRLYRCRLGAEFGKRWFQRNKS